MKSLKKYRIYPYINLYNKPKLITRTNLGEEFLFHKTQTLENVKEDFQIYQKELNQGSILYLTPKGLHLTIRSLPKLEIIVLELNSNNPKKLAGAILRLERVLLENNFNRYVKLIVKFSETSVINNARTLDKFFEEYISLKDGEISIINSLIIDYQVYSNLTILPDFIKNLGLIVNSFKEQSNPMNPKRDFNKIFIFLNKSVPKETLETLKEYLETISINLLTLPIELLNILNSNRIKYKQIIYKADLKLEKLDLSKEKSIIIETFTTNNTLRTTETPSLYFSDSTRIPINEETKTYILNIDKESYEYQEILFERNYFVIKDFDISTAIANFL